MVRDRQSKAGEGHFGAGYNEWLHSLVGEEAGWNRASCRLALWPRASTQAWTRPWTLLLKTSGVNFFEEESTHDTDTGTTRVHRGHPVRPHRKDRLIVQAARLRLPQLRNLRWGLRHLRFRAAGRRTAQQYPPFLVVVDGADQRQRRRHRRQHHHPPARVGSQRACREL